MYREGFTGDSVASETLHLYSTLGYKPPPNKFTVLASFVLSTTDSDELKVISLATGSKCLPEIRLPENGDALHDSHAEVLARRGAVRWFMEEVQRTASGTGSAPAESRWICKDPLFDKFSLRSNVRLHMYVSTVPCGDASMRFLASFQDPEMAALKDSSVFPALGPDTASRGRDNYSLYGVLRTKPGRADSPPTLSMSCSDKIASWNVLGIQGALASQFLGPIYVSSVVIGEVDDGMQDIVLEDCNRAFHGRLVEIEDKMKDGFRLNKPFVSFTSLAFAHSRTSLGVPSSCNESLTWVADSFKEVLINGLRRGISPKHRLNAKFRPNLCKASMLHLYTEIVTSLQLPSNEFTYYRIKKSMINYQRAKSVLQGRHGPFAGWMRSGERWENFTRYV